MKHQYQNLDMVEVDAYEPDLDGLCQEIEAKAVQAVALYGTGMNAGPMLTVLGNLGVEVERFIDLKGNWDSSFQGKPMITPQQFMEKYHDEYIVISPNVHDDIVAFFLEHGVHEDKLIVPFLKRETVTINYGFHLTRASENIGYCSERPVNPKVTFVTIAYNTPDYMFRRCIESTLRQTERQFIHTIIINGATDNTLEIAREYAGKDARIELVELKENLVWTDMVLIDAVKDHVYGDYMCQLDSDDYYDERFLEYTLREADEKEADVVCVRKVRFCADPDYCRIQEGTDYDMTAAKYTFSHPNPKSGYCGKEQVITGVITKQFHHAMSGKLFSRKLMRKYYQFLSSLSLEQRNMYFRLDISMGYQVLSLSSKVLFLNNILHFVTFSGRSSTYSEAPPNWLMAIWYVYKDMRRKMYIWHNRVMATNVCKDFLKRYLLWAAQKKSILNNIEGSEYQENIMVELRDMRKDQLVMEALETVKKGNWNCKEFYDKFMELTA